MKPTLKFKSDGSFRILIMSDMHHAPDTGIKVVSDMERLIEHTQPDLVLLGGDNTTGKSTKAQFVELLVQIAEPMERRGLPWAHVFGNHDISPDVSKEYQQSVYESYPHCLSQAGPEELSGVGNWFLPILGATGEPVCGVWGLDSHQDFKTLSVPLDTLENPYWSLLMPERIASNSDSDFVRFDQVEWYYEGSKALEKRWGRRIPSLMLLHIPLAEFAAIPKNPGRTGFRGEYNERICASEVNSGLFAALLQRGDVKCVFAGHDHINTFEGVYCGIRMGYVGSVGDHGYGAREFDPGHSRERLRGGRIIDLHEAAPERMDTEMLLLNTI